MSVPQLLTVVCHPKNYMTFSSMGLMIMEKVRSDYFWEHDNYLRNFHLNSSKYLGVASGGMAVRTQALTGTQSGLQAGCVCRERVQVCLCVCIWHVGV